LSANEVDINNEAEGEPFATMGQGVTIHFVTGHEKASEATIPHQLKVRSV
jgi:hypothetical protein